jgi:hypothetical protein
MCVPVDSGLGVRDRPLDLVGRTSVGSLAECRDCKASPGAGNSRPLAELFEDRDRGVCHLHELVARDPAGLALTLGAVEPRVPLELPIPILVAL